MNDAVVITALIMLVGVIGSILPFIPGPPLIWLGALYYAWRTGWVELGWPILTLLLVLALVGGTADWWMGYLGASTGGASIWATIASMVGGIAGFFIFNLPGMLIGSIGAIALVEYSRHRDWRKTLRAGGGYLVGSLLAAVVEVIIALAMIGIFVAAIYV